MAIHPAQKKRSKTMCIKITICVIYTNQITTRALKLTLNKWALTGFKERKRLACKWYCVVPRPHKQKRARLNFQINICFSGELFLLTTSFIQENAAKIQLYHTRLTFFNIQYGFLHRHKPYGAATGIGCADNGVTPRIMVFFDQWNAWTLILEPMPSTA